MNLTCQESSRELVGTFTTRVLEDQFKVRAICFLNIDECLCLWLKTHIEVFILEDSTSLKDQQAEAPALSMRHFVCTPVPFFRQLMSWV